MSEIKFPPILEILRKRLQADMASATLADQIVPVMVLENDRWEYRFPEGARIASGAFQPSTLVNSTNWLHVGLENPAGSNILITIDGIWGRVRYDNLTPGARASQPRVLRISAGALADLQLVAFMRDFRWDAGTGGSRAPQGQIRSESNAAEQGILLMDSRGISEAGDPADGEFSLFWDFPDVGIVIPPGEGVAVSVQGRNPGNTRHFATFAWTERQMSAWEASAIPAG